MLQFDSGKNFSVGPDIYNKYLTEGNTFLNGANHMLARTNTGNFYFMPQRTSTMTITKNVVTIEGSLNTTGLNTSVLSVTGDGIIRGEATFLKTTRIAGTLVTSSTVIMGSTLTVDGFVRISSNNGFRADDTNGVSHNLAYMSPGNIQFLCTNTYATVLNGSTVCLKTAGGTTVTSDRNKKHDIHSLMDASMDKYEAFFDHLDPVIYKYNEGNSGLFHVGAIAQDVEESLIKSGLTTMDFAGYKRMQTNDDEYSTELHEELGLTYNEFIMLSVMKIKKLEQRLAKLEQTKDNK